MHTLILEIDLHIPEATSLKAKRSVVQSLVRRIDDRHGVAAAEVDEHDTHQRAVLGAAIVGGSPGHLERVGDDIDRFIWSEPRVEVLDIARSWWSSE